MLARHGPSRAPKLRVQAGKVGEGLPRSSAHSDHGLLAAIALRAVLALHHLAEPGIEKPTIQVWAIQGLLCRLVGRDRRGFDERHATTPALKLPVFARRF